MSMDHAWNNPSVLASLASGQTIRKAVAGAAESGGPGKATEFAADADDDRAAADEQSRLLRLAADGQLPEAAAPAVSPTSPPVPARAARAREEPASPPGQGGNPDEAGPEPPATVPSLDVEDETEEPADDMSSPGGPTLDGVYTVSAHSGADAPTAPAGPPPPTQDSDGGADPGTTEQAHGRPDRENGRRALFTLRRPPFLNDRRRLRTAFGILCVFGILSAGLSAYWSDGRQPRPIGGSSRAPGLDPTPGGEVQKDSADYRETLIAANDAGSETALTGQGSYLPTVEALPEAVEDRPAPEPAAAGMFSEEMPAAAPESLWAAAELSGPVPYDSETAAHGASLPPAPATADPMLDFLTALAERPVPRMGTRSFAEAEAAPPQALTQALTSSAAAPVVPGGAPADTGIRPGDLLHAEMLHSLNSDFPGPAVAEISEGRWRGARVVGDFTPKPAEGGLLLRFSELALPDGRILPIEAWGLSPWTGQTLTRSRLEPRWPARFGPTGLAGLLSGAAAVAAAGGQRLIASGDNPVLVRDPGEREIIAAGVSSALGAVRRSLADSTPVGPRILLEAGSPVVLLFAGAPDRRAFETSPASPPATQLTADSTDSLRIPSETVLPEPPAPAPGAFFQSRSIR